MTQTRSKSFSDWITRVVATTTIVGVRTGRTMRQKICRSLAPSTRAASSISVEIPFSPADSTTTAKPVSRLPGFLGSA